MGEQRRDFKTEAFVLRRTNYKEADRILSILTPEGKKSVLAKGVRKEKSKLAGGIEMFCLTEINLHIGRGELLTLTGAKMNYYYKHILADLSRLELAAEVIKEINRAAEQVSSVEYFSLLKQVFSGLDSSLDLKLVEVWFLFNFARINGEAVNLLRDVGGEKLDSKKRYFWDYGENALRENKLGNIGANEIKAMRILFTNRLEVVKRVRGIEKLLEPVFPIARAVNKR